LLGHAATESPFEFAKRVEAFVQKHSADDGRSDFDKKKSRRSLRLWTDNDGMTRLSGLLDPVSGQVVKTTLDRIADQLWRRDHRDQAMPVEERSNEARYADALVQACHRADRTDNVKKTPDKAIVVLSYDDLVEKLDAAGISPFLGDGTPIPASVARRLACDAGLIPMVLGGDSVVLDEGRSKRVATDAQRAALKLQWSTCSIADCTVPFEWTEIHHVTPFNEHGANGETNLDELTPACNHCHDLAHCPGWTVDKHSDGTVTTTAPDGRRWQRKPNRLRNEPPDAAAIRPSAATSGEAATLFSDAA
jgi:hypothetical protein